MRERYAAMVAPKHSTGPARSKHVEVLERAGLVRRARQGREHTLELNADPLRDVARWAHRYTRPGHGQA